MVTTLTPAQVLELPMPNNDASAPTIGAYLITLLRELWLQQDEFSGKRPFGNSGWDSEVIIALINANAINGTIDEDGYLDYGYDQGQVDTIMVSAINSLFPINQE